MKIIIIGVILTLVSTKIDAWGLKIFSNAPPSSSTELPLSQSPASATNSPVPDLDLSNILTDPTPEILLNTNNVKDFKNEIKSIFKDPSSFQEYVSSIWGDKIPNYIKVILLYKPPVGIATLYVGLNLIMKRKKLFAAALMYDQEQKQAAQFTSSWRRKKNWIIDTRSFELDKADDDYDNFGGVEAVRAQLLSAALCEYIQVESTTESKDSGDTSSELGDKMNNDLTDKSTLSLYANAARDALETNAIPKSPKEEFAERMLEPLGRLEGLYSILSKGNNFFTTKTMNKSEMEAMTILWTSTKVAEIRCLDALLRILRDRLVNSAMRLSRKERSRAARLRWYESGYAIRLKRWIRRTLRGTTLSDDRMNYQLTSAALKREMERLGQVQKMLLSRPDELNETRLLTVSSITLDEIRDTSTLFGDGTNTEEEENEDTLPACGSNGISAMAAKEVLSTKSNSDKEAKKWSTAAESWTMQSRGLISELVSETLSSVYKTTDHLSRDRLSSVGEDISSLQKWAQYESNGYNDWVSALSLVDALSKARLLREKKYLPASIDIKYWAKRLDFLSIPSSFAMIGASLVLHNVVKPYWTNIVDVTKVVAKTIWGIIEFRFYAPLRDIILDLLNRRPRLLDAYSLANEEMSLDNMLRDLDLGDGLAINRNEALAAASRLYEEELSQGAVKNLLRGRMVRLLLIQMQQLKTELLKAMGSIDLVYDSNRLNLQLLASIPAFLLVTFGTRAFFGTLYKLRSRDIEGLPNAHAEMADLLSRMERCLLLASYTTETNGQMLYVRNENTKKKSNGQDDVDIRAGVTLQPKELGEFVLLMHSYLVLLDYCSPPFPAKAGDSIHSGMKDLLMQGKLTTKRQIALLQLINVKHSELLKSI